MNNTTYISLLCAVSTLFIPAECILGEQKRNKYFALIGPLLFVISQFLQWTLCPESTAPWMVSMAFALVQIFFGTRFGIITLRILISCVVVAMLMISVSVWYPFSFIHSVPSVLLVGVVGIVLLPVKKSSMNSVSYSLLSLVYVGLSWVFLHGSMDSIVSNWCTVFWFMQAISFIDRFTLLHWVQGSLWRFKPHLD